SGGQRQRVMIAMALACDPQLIIADEPTTALDVMVQAQVLDLLAELVAERDAGLLMISHDLSVLARPCQRLAVMYAGRTVEHGPAETVVRAPGHPSPEALPGAFPTIGDPAARPAPPGLPGDPPGPHPAGPATPGRRVGVVRGRPAAAVHPWPAGLPPAGAVRAAGPDRGAQPEAHRVRGGRRGPADPPDRRRGTAPGGRSAVPGRV